VSAPSTTAPGRRRIWRYGFALVLSVLAAAFAARVMTSEPPTQIPPREEQWTVGAYLSPWDETRGLASLSRAGSVLTSLSPVWYTPDDDGRLVRNHKSATETIFAAAHGIGLKVIPSVSNYRSGVWDGPLVGRLVNDPELRRTHIAQIVNLVLGQGWDGIDIDYENLATADLVGFAEFVAELGSALHEQGRSLTVALRAATDGAAPEVAQLYRAVGTVADEVRVMAYDLSWNESDPGSVAPVTWVEDVLDFAVAHVPRERIVLGLAGHGYDWPAGSYGDDLMWADAVALADHYDRTVQWDNQAKSPWLAYTTGDGGEHTVWFEDSRSLAAKLRVAVDRGVGGVFLWRLGGEDPQIWALLKSP
jgi:spore germination protein YaaH